MGLLGDFFGSFLGSGRTVYKETMDEATRATRAAKGLLRLAEETEKTAHKVGKIRRMRSHDLLDENVRKKILNLTSKYKGRDEIRALHKEFSDQLIAYGAGLYDAMSYLYMEAQMTKAASLQERATIKSALKKDLAEMEQAIESHALRGMQEELRKRKLELEKELQALG